VSQKDLKQAIADAKTYIQKLGKILRRDVTSKSNDHKNPSIKNEPFCDTAKPVSLGQTEALQIKTTWRADLGGYSVKERCHSLH
jgi:hypothetical protein